MVFLAAGWAFIVTFLLLASEPEQPLPFVIALVCLVLMVTLRSFFHVREDKRHEEMLDVVLSLFLSAMSLSLLVSTLLPVLGSPFPLRTFLEPRALLFVSLNLLVLFPFAALSLWSLFSSLRAAHAKRR